VIAKQATRRGLTEEEVEALIRSQVDGRRRDLRQRRSTGRPSEIDLHLGWAIGVAETREELVNVSYADEAPEPTDRDATREFARLNVARSDDPNEIERATQQVWMAVTRLAKRGYRTGLSRHELPANRH
jgi:hypothetical protein